MSRKSVLLAVGIAALVVGVVATALVLLVYHEPAFYARAAVPPGKERQELSRKLMTHSTQLFSNIKARHPKWYGLFTDVEINSYFKEQFLRQGLALPEGVSDPRVALEDNQLRLGFRYGSGIWSTIVSLDLRLWVAKQEPNAVALELQGLHAGALPFSAQSLLERLLEVWQGRNLDVKWYRYNGHPCALLRFRSDSPRPSVQLLDLQLRQGLFVVKGRSVPQPGPATQAGTGPLPGGLAGAH